MSIKAKVFSIVGIIAVFFGFLTFGIQRWLVLPSYQALEEREARKNVERCTEALDREFSHLQLLCLDWSAWDDTYQFVQDRNTDYIDSNLIRETFTSGNLNLIYFFDDQKQLIWGQVWDLDPPGKISLPDFAWPDLPYQDLLLNHPNIQSSVSGLIMTQKGPLMISANPVITSHNQGPIRGILIMGRFLTEPLVQEISSQTRLNLSMTPVSKVAESSEGRLILERMNPETKMLFHADNPQWMMAYGTYPDIAGTPALLLRVLMPREIMQQGKATLRTAGLWGLGLGFVVLVASIVLIQIFVIRPLTAAGDHGQ